MKLLARVAQINQHLKTAEELAKIVGTEDALGGDPREAISVLL